jgi:hypothetical protein
LPWSTALAHVLTSVDDKPNRVSELGNVDTVTPLSGPTSSAMAFRVFVSRMTTETRLRSNSASDKLFNNDSALELLGTIPMTT